LVSMSSSPRSQPPSSQKAPCRPEPPGAVSSRGTDHSVIAKQKRTAESAAAASCQVGGLLHLPDFASLPGGAGVSPAWRGGPG
jgi:hypothetical protein